VSATSEEKHIGKSIENMLREIFEKELSGDPKARDLALKILEEYKSRGRKGVKELLESLVEQYDASLEGA